MLWGLTDRFVDEVIEVYRSREQAERALEAVLADEPEWEGMMEIVPVPPGCGWEPPGRRAALPRCREV
jgi:hypothetical protein